MDGERAELVPRALEPLPLGALRPRGWLLDQLRIQAEGLSGHLESFWPDVSESGWIGGAAEGWERGPYWLDGTVPLAFLLQDAPLIGRVRHWMDAILSAQSADGWLGPRQDMGTGRYRPLDPWPVSVFVKGALQYHSATGDPRIPPALSSFYRRLADQLASTPLFDWGRMRWPELVLGMEELYEQTSEADLLALARETCRQGYDWDRLFREYPYRGRTGRCAIAMPTHVVNNTMAIKGGALRYRLSHDPVHLAGTWRMIDLLEAYHGQVTGVFTGDEHLAGRDPSQGTELCAVVELMYSLEVLASVLGDPSLVDRLERIAFNALPATFRPDMWAHQYDQQVNQPVCQVVSDPIYTNNAPESNIYGLEPNYGCCTANMHQGWPKYASSLWMRSPASRGRKEGLAALSLAPCELRCRLSGEEVYIRVDSDYPFGEEARILVQASVPLSFCLRIRIPDWAEGATVRIQGHREMRGEPGTFCDLDVDVAGYLEVSIRLPMRLRVETRYHGSASILYGPLVLALQIQEEWRQIGGTLPHGDWEVHPTTPWNYALVLDRHRPERCIRVSRGPLGATPFSPDGAPVRARVMGARLTSWGLERGTAGSLPWSPVIMEAPLEPLCLIPFGATNIRIAEFPTVQGAESQETAIHDAMP